MSDDLCKGGYPVLGHKQNKLVAPDNVPARVRHASWKSARHSSVKDGGATKDALGEDGAAEAHWTRVERAPRDPHGFRPRRERFPAPLERSSVVFGKPNEARMRTARRDIS